MTEHWLEHFMRMFRMLTGCDMTTARYALKAHPEWVEEYDELDCCPDSTLDRSFVVSCSFDGQHGFVGAFRIRTDQFFYGATIDGGNHDLDVGELCAGMKRAGRLVTIRIMKGGRA